MTDTITCGDAIAFMRELPADAVDLFLTDIPYARVNQASRGLRVLDKHFANHLSFRLDEFATQAVRITSGNGVIFCGKEQFSPLYQTFTDLGLTTRMLVWEKTNPSPMNGQYLFLSGVECAVHFRKPRATFNARHRNTVFRFPNGSSRRHPTEKPLALFTRLVEMLSDPGDTVCDPCVGSGTTAVAAVRLRRRFRCCDIHADYVRLARDRVAEARCQTA